MRRIALAAVVIAVLVLAYFLHTATSGPPPTCGKACTGTTPVCDSASGSCVGCGDDEDCPAGTLCNPSGACTRCRGTAEGCPLGQYCEDGTICGECRPGWNADCNNNPGGPVCSDAYTCVDCRDNSDCAAPGRPPGAPYCSPAGRCVACLSSRDCSGVSAYCDAGGACVACDASDPGSCEGGYCVTGSGGPACAPCVAGDPSRPCEDGTYCVTDADGDSVCVECVAGDPTRGCPSGSICAGGACYQSCRTNADCGEGSSTPNCIEGVCVKCSTDSDCASEGPYATCANGLCVECTVDAQGVQTGCSGAAPYCYDNACQQCSPSDGNGDCSGATPFCALDPGAGEGSYRCVQCVSDTYCEGLDGGARPRCDAGSHTCVACNAEYPCDAGLNCIGGLCAECGTDDDCAAGGGGAHHCVGGQCVSCAGDTDCQNPAAPYCTNGACAACRGDYDCAEPTPRCAADGSACVACVDNEDCATDPARLCSAKGACVACRGDGDCSAPTPHCATDGSACVECAAPADCGGNPCLNGTCANCRKNCDCGSVDAAFCDKEAGAEWGVCEPLPENCWSWKRWHLTDPFPADEAMGGTHYVAAIGAIGDSVNGDGGFLYGEALRNQTDPYDHLASYHMRGNMPDDKGKDYNLDMEPNWDMVWYLAAEKGCGRPGQSTDTTHDVIRFPGDDGPVTSGQGVCATLKATSTGDHVFSTNTWEGCGPPGSVGTFVFMSQRPKGINDCAA